LSQLLFLGSEDEKSCDFARFASKIGLLGVFCGFCDERECRRDTLVGYFSGRVGDEAKKSLIFATKMHFDVAATLCKIGIRERMGV
jgi:hypothetical protein